MLSKCMLLSLVLAMVFSLSACGPKGITFPDPNFEAAIREAIDKPKGPLLTTDLERLTSLDAEVRRITDLTGLEYCTNLRALVLQGNEISDLSPLASLTNLTTLWLQGNQISDISPLVSLTNLTELALGVNPLSSTSINAYIPQLRERGVYVTR